MAMRDSSPEKIPSGCGLFNIIFRNRVFWLRRSASSASSTASSIPSPKSTPNPNSGKSPRTPASFRRKNKDGTTNHQRTVSAASSTGSEVPLRQSIPPKDKKSENKFVSLDPSKERRVPRGAIGISGELESMIAEQQKLARNATMLGNLGNLRQSPTNNLNPGTNYINWSIN